jgi:hypothetical protein
MSARAWIAFAVVSTLWGNPVATRASAGPSREVAPLPGRRPLPDPATRALYG